MFFILSKLFWVFARPLNFLFFTALLALLLRAFGLRRLPNFLLAVAGLLFVAIGFTQLPDLLIHQMESRFEAAVPNGKPYGIIVLGGGLSASAANQTSAYHVGESGDRLIHGLELRRRYPDARLIYSGGLGSLSQSGDPETLAAQALVEALYGDTVAIEFESNSRNTWQNAQYVAELIGEDRQRPWLLVTSAFHMPRAMGCFRQAGVNVFPAPADFRADVLQAPYLTGNVAGQFLKLSVLVKEIFGLVAYRLTGRTNTLFPG